MKFSLASLHRYNVHVLPDTNCQVYKDNEKNMLILFVAVVANEAFVTLATNDSYALGALVLGNSLRQVHTTRKLAIMLTSGISQGIR